MLLAVLAFTAGGVAQGNFVYKEKFNQTQICDVEGCVITRQQARMSAKGVYDWGDVDFGQMNNSTEFNLDIGEFSFTRTLGQANSYTPGDTKATFLYSIGLGGSDTRIAKITVSWKNGKTKFKARIFQSCYSQGYSLHAADTYPASLDLNFGMETLNGSSFGVTRQDEPGAAIVEQQEKRSPEKVTLKTQVTVTGAFD